jgi:hypothetical protein
MKKILFRVDDVGLDNNRFERLKDIFITLKIPFAAGIIPTKEILPHLNNDLISFFQHGYRHLNRSLEAKKNEFPEHLELEGSLKEIYHGWELLEQSGLPLWKAFCPPWNRMRADLKNRLSKDYFILGGKETATTERSLPYHIDLHTLAIKPEIGQIMLEINKHDSPCVLMLHHTFMDENDFIRLKVLLETMKKESYIFLHARKDL